MKRPSTATVCVDFAVQGGGPPEVATGGEDGAVRIWDTRQRDASVAAFAPATADQVVLACAQHLPAARSATK